ncbi:MAG TPA: hypothetical protein PLI43_01855 [Albidovulum sp.]|uniref:hypothetical protein n=1 Tax=Albidovulum sp. TaxID=1872424 RepID=UPI002BE5BBF7|nr:hypothetical protein [Albidovulum sp.]
MRVFVAIVALLAILAGAAWATRPGEAEFDAMLKQAIEEKIAKTDVGSSGDDALGTVALIGCKLRPSDCMKLIRDSLEVTVEKGAFTTRYKVSGLKQEATCTGAFTKIWCEKGAIAP